MKIFFEKLCLEQYEGIYEVLNQYSIRSITFDGLNETTADRIIKMRPMPSNFIIFARPTEMAVIFENVIFNNFISRINFLNNHPMLQFTGNQVQGY